MEKIAKRRHISTGSLLSTRIIAPPRGRASPEASTESVPMSHAREAATAPESVYQCRSFSRRPNYNE